MAEDLDDAQPARRAYLVLNDYGMGGLWWWVVAASASTRHGSVSGRRRVGRVERLDSQFRQRYLEGSAEHGGRAEQRQHGDADGRLSLVLGFLDKVPS